METDGDIIEAEGYRKSEVFGFRELFLMQVRRCIDKQSQEMREGFWIYTTTPNMTPQKTKYVGDVREEFTNSVISLHDLSQPKFDEDMKTKSKAFTTKFNQEHKKALENYEKADSNAKKVPKEWNKRKVELYRELFQQLCYFGNRLNWFESSKTEE